MMRIALFSFLPLLLLTHPALGHGIGAKATLENGVVQVEGYFDDDTPADMAKVRVENDKGQLIAEGTTDEKGLWSFPVPSAGTYRIVLDAGAGHVARVKLHIPEEALQTMTVSEGPSREEFTQTPWFRLGLGLGLIGLLACGVTWLLRAGRKPSGNPG